ncbi:MAG: DUF192 domain-containing protein [Steroidobacteraceae bacterium]
MPTRLIRLLILLPLMLAAAVRTSATEELQRFPSAVLSIRTHQTTEWFNVWIADSTARQEQGLMFQKWLPADWGMLFPEDSPRVKSMWMKNTLIPLDMLFIDSAGRIVSIRANATPESLDIITFPRPVKAVLELNGGACARSGIRIGDQVRFNLFGVEPQGPLRK